MEKEDTLWMDTMLAPDKSEFVNLTPYHIIVINLDGSTLIEWQPSNHPIVLEYMHYTQHEPLSSLLGFPINYPKQCMGFKSGVPLGGRGNIIVTEEVGRFMQAIAHPWHGYVLSPSKQIEPGIVDKISNRWTVRRMLCWRLTPSPTNRVAENF